MSKTVNLKALSATQVRTILLIATVALLLGQVGLIIAGQRIILSSSQPVAEAVAQASSSQQTLRDLETVKVALEKQEETVKKSALVAADASNTYLYQNNIINDISTYATKAGLNPTSYTFSDSSSGSAESTATAATPAATEAAPPADAAPADPSAAPAAAAAAPTTATVTVAFDGDVTYTSLFNFLRLLEGNLLRMEIDGINLSRTSGGTEEGGGPADKLDISSLIIKVHTR